MILFYFKMLYYLRLAYQFTNLPWLFFTFQWWEPFRSTIWLFLWLLLYIFFVVSFVCYLYSAFKLCFQCPRGTFFISIHADITVCLPSLWAQNPELGSFRTALKCLRQSFLVIIVYVRLSMDNMIAETRFSFNNQAFKTNNKT